MPSGQRKAVSPFKPAQNLLSDPSDKGRATTPSILDFRSGTSFGSDSVPKMSVSGFHRQVRRQLHSGFSPFVNTMTNYSPAHLQHVKMILRHSPAYYMAVDGENINSLPATQPMRHGSSTSWLDQTFLQATDDEFLPGACYERGVDCLRHSEGCTSPKVTIVTEKQICKTCYAQLAPASSKTSYVDLEKFDGSGPIQCIDETDRFGNTFLHFVAARGLLANQLISLIRCKAVTRSSMQSTLRGRLLCTYLDWQRTTAIWRISSESSQTSSSTLGDRISLAKPFFMS